MVQLEQLNPGITLKGLAPQGAVKIVQVRWHGADSLTLWYEDEAGRPDKELIFRADEARLEIAAAPEQRPFDGDGRFLQLVTEAQRIRWAHLFDPYLAVHTSQIEPLPHQITAVYDKMLARQPLRYLLADDPGAGKTIMAGLLIKELWLRGDARRCLIVCPGGLVEQWQDELSQKFQLPFELLTNDRIAAARSGNIFQEIPLLIARVDKLARDEQLHPLLAQSDWDLIVCDEAHKLSATVFGQEIKYTKRYNLGKLLSDITRHFLLMTATPHNGKEEDFQLFMALLDEDRFAGRFREGVHQSDVSDLMRRMVKEQLLKFDGKPLFPERRAYTVPYELTNLEQALYDEVTAYVKEGFNRAERLEDGRRKGTVGFALTILQRRLASSPEAIYQSLRRRRERLEARLREEEAGRLPDDSWLLDEDDLEELDEATAAELEELEERLIDQSTTASTIAELRLEIENLRHLEERALQVRRSGLDRKWDELSGLLQEQSEMFDAQGQRRKLVIFTEHKDTLTYLADRIRALLGRPEMVAVIHGGVQRKDRRAVQHAFTQEKQVQVLVATDAAGEGINLQRAHLMVNYDLPWNPNRLEQRFGRIHRIGQTEVCHLWNLVADKTREGDVYITLLRKLERERTTLGGAVFDVLGKAIDGKRLRELMIEAIRDGDRPEVRARLHQVVEGALDQRRLEELIQERALTHDMLPYSQVQEIRHQMEQMEARRLQPHYIQRFFRQALDLFGGRMRPRENGRYEITHIPAAIRRHGQSLAYHNPIAASYQRICFSKEGVQQAGKPPADFICPGHPLLDTLIDLLLSQGRDALRQGAVLVDENDPGQTARALFYLEHTIRDGRVADGRSAADGRGDTGPLTTGGQRRVISRRFQFVERDLGAAEWRNAGPAPYLDYRPLREEERPLLAAHLPQLLPAANLEEAAILYAVQEMAQPHLAEIRDLREPLIAKSKQAVHARLTAEIAYWDMRAQELQAQEAAGRKNARLNSAKAQQRADELAARRQKRLAELEQERQLSAQEPVVVGGALIIPLGLLARWQQWPPEELEQLARDAAARRRVELAAMAAVMAAERALGNTPHDVSGDNRGYDILSLTPENEQRFIEVKGRTRGAPTITVTHNEIMVALNSPRNWILAIVQVPPEASAATTPGLLHDERAIYQVGQQCETRYLLRPFTTEPNPDSLGENFDLRRLWERGAPPAA